MNALPMIALIQISPALLLEALFYFLPAWPAFRERFLKVNPYVQAGLVWVSGMAPILLLNLLQGRFPEDFALLATAAAIVCGWYLVLPRRPVADILLMILLAAFILSSWFQDFFPSPEGAPKLAALAKLLWLRIGIAVYLFVRRWPVPGFGLWPDRRDWVEGTRQFAIFMAILLPIGIYFKLLRYQLPKVEPWQLPLLALGTFVAFFVFLAFGEDFFFRGVLQPLLTKELGGRWRALLTASICFGAVHLPFRGFPNWRQAAVATALGIFCGISFNRANSLRAAMITHALVVTVWTVCFARSF